MSELTDIESQLKSENVELIALEKNAIALKTRLFEQAKKGAAYQPDMCKYIAEIARKQAEVSRMLQEAINFFENQE